MVLDLVQRGVFVSQDQGDHWPLQISLRNIHAFVYAPRQWEMTLQCNVVFHWLSTFTKWPLVMSSYNLGHVPGSHCWGYYPRTLPSVWVSATHLKIGHPQTKFTCPILGKISLHDRVPVAGDCLERGHQDGFPSNGHRGDMCDIIIDMPYWNQK